MAGLTLRDKAQSSAIQENLCIELLLLSIEGNQLRLFGLLVRMPPQWAEWGEAVLETTDWEETLLLIDPAYYGRI